MNDTEVPDRLPMNAKRTPEEWAAWMAQTKARKRAENERLDADMKRQQETWRIAKEERERREAVLEAEKLAETLWMRAEDGERLRHAAMTHANGNGCGLTGDDYLILIELFRDLCFTIPVDEDESREVRASDLTPFVHGLFDLPAGTRERLGRMLLALSPEPIFKK